MRKIIIVFTLVLQAFGFEHQYIHKSYEDAQSDTDNYIRVAGESTKLGFITTEYDGFVKKYKISYLKKNEKIEALYIKISASSIDTDNSLRDEKMNNETLDTKKNEFIIFTSKESLVLREGSTKLSGILSIRSKEHLIDLNLDVEKEGVIFRIKGKAEISLKDFNIPDPSIAIAKVKDSHTLEFGHVINE